jgi:hypothetical protein
MKKVKYKKVSNEKSTWKVWMKVMHDNELNLWTFEDFSSALRGATNVMRVCDKGFYWYDCEGNEFWESMRGLKICWIYSRVCTKIKSQIFLV